MKSGSTKSILSKIEQRFREGAFQREINDLPFEIQFQLGCSWGRALCEANRIRVAK
jgi:hypothetical protein